ncbi:hypothetical protein M0Q50_07675 [bacterium]|jgi:hypothetical protein|nr:hypothetical protein [bacterium]
MSLKTFEKYKKEESIEDIYQNVVDNNTKLVKIVKTYILDFFNKYSLDYLDMKVLSGYDGIYDGVETIEKISSDSYDVKYQSDVTQSNNSIQISDNSIDYMGYGAMYEIYNLLNDLDIETILSYCGSDGNKKSVLKIIENNLSNINFEKEVQLQFDEGKVFYHLGDIKNDEDFQELVFDKDEPLFAKMVNKYGMVVNGEFMKRRGDEIDAVINAKNLGLY